MERTKKNIFILCCSFILICAVTFSAKVISYIDTPAIKMIVRILLNVLNGVIAFAAAKLSGMKINEDFKNKRQYIIGVGIALVLSAAIAVIPALCGVSLVGGHMDFSLFEIVYHFLFYMLIIGPIEEFVFRVYYQNAFVSLFHTRKWLGVVAASLLFGLWHIINGNIFQVVFTFGIGLVFGFSKYKIKDLGYFGISASHGLYDFLNIIVRMFIV